VPTDEELLDAWRSGDLAAAEQLFDRHFAALYRFFFNKVGDAVDDLVQRTLLACVESRDRFRGAASFRTFLFAVARKQLYAHYKARSGKEPDRLSSVPDAAQSPAELLVEHEEEKLLLRALRRLPFDFQIAFELFYWEGLGHAELSAVLEIPLGTVKTRLRAGRQQLERELAEVAGNRELLASTADNLDAWAKGIRACVEAPRRPIKPARRNKRG